MSFLPATPSAHRRELAHRERMRLEQFEGKLDRLVVEMGAAAKPSSLPTAEDIQDLAERLAEDCSGPPHGSDVQTRAEDNSPPAAPMVPPTWTAPPPSPSRSSAPSPRRELLETGLVKGGTFQAHVYERMLSEVDGVVKGKLIGSRDIMFARQEAARAKYSQLWHN